MRPDDNFTRATFTNLEASCVSVSNNADFTACSDSDCEYPKDIRAAVVGAGYADGYPRLLSCGKGVVEIHGKACPVLGRVCMDQMMVDVTDIPGVQAGDTVTLIGTDGDETISMEEIAAAAGSFNYEFACGISRRVPRVYLRGGQAVHTVHYLTDVYHTISR